MGQSRLDRIFNSVNHRHFDRAIDLSVEWGVPPIAYRWHSGNDESRTDQDHLVNAARLVGEKLAAYLPEYPVSRFVEVVRNVSLGEPDAVREYSRLSTDNRVCAELGLVLTGLRNQATGFGANSVILSEASPACILHDAGTILIHPYLKQKNAPLAVLEYLIFHEILHVVCNTTPEDPHPVELRERDLVAPHRERAWRWLEKHGFPAFCW